MTWVWIAVGGAVLLGIYLGLIIAGVIAAAATVRRNQERSNVQKFECSDVLGSKNDADLDLEELGVGCRVPAGCGGDAGADGHPWGLSV